MVKARFDPFFKKRFSKIKDRLLKEKIKKQVLKIKNNPEIGKPMRYDRRGTREVYIPPFRLSYKYLKERNRIFFIVIYHKDEQ